MKKLLLFICLIVSIGAMSQAGYIIVNEKRNQLALRTGMLTVPAGTTPALGTGQWSGAGALFVDTTGGNKGLFYYRDGVFIRVVDTAMANFLYTSSNGITKTSNNFKLGGTLIEGTSIDADDNFFDMSNIDDLSFVVTGATGGLTIKRNVSGVQQVYVASSGGMSMEQFTTANPSDGSEILITKDRIQFSPRVGNLIVDSLLHDINATDKMVTWDSASGTVQTRAIPSTTVPALQQVLATESNSPIITAINTNISAGGSANSFNIIDFPQIGLSGGSQITIIAPDSLVLNSDLYHVAHLRYTPGPSTKMMVWDSLNNKWGTQPIPSAGSGTVTTVGFTGGLISVANPTTTPAFTVAGTSGGIPYFSSSSTWATTGPLVINNLMIGGGVGSGPSTTSTGSGILTWLGTPSSANLAAALTDETGTGSVVFSNLPIFTGGAVIPLVAGGTGTTSTLILESTSGAGSGDAIIFKTGSQIEAGRMTGGTAPIITFGGTATTTAAETRWLEPSGSGTNYIGFKAAAMAGNTTYTLPNAFPAGTYLMQSTNAGVLSFIDPSTIPGTFALTNGSGTTANGTAVDWGGTLNSGVIISASQNIINFDGTGSQDYGDISNASTGLVFSVQPDNNIVTIDRPAHTALVGINKQPIVALDISGDLQVSSTMSVGDVLGSAVLSVFGTFQTTGTNTFVDLAGTGNGTVGVDASGVLGRINGSPVTTISSDRSTSQTAAKTLASYTVGGSDETLEVSANILINTATLHNFTARVVYTDEGNTSRTVTLNFSTLAGALTPTIANAGGAQPYEGVPLHIRAKSGTTVTLSTAGTFTTVNYNFESYIKKM